MSEGPQRRQRQRARGYRNPPNSQYCGRGSEWGNPFTLAGGWTREEAIANFKVYADWRLQMWPKWIDPLESKDNLLCFCGLDESCHVDYLVTLVHYQIIRKRELIQP